ELTVEVANPRSKMSIPTIFNAITMARRQLHLFDAAIRDSTNLDLQLTDAVDLERPVALEPAFRLSQLARPELTDKIGIDKAQELIRLDVGAAAREAATLDQKGEPATILDR